MAGGRDGGEEEDESVAPARGKDRLQPEPRWESGRVLTSGGPRIGVIRSQTRAQQCALITETEHTHYQGPPQRI